MPDIVKVATSITRAIAARFLIFRPRGVPEPSDLLTDYPRALKESWKSDEFLVKAHRNRPASLEWARTASIVESDICTSKHVAAGM
jgi:hypothetical protein